MASLPAHFRARAVLASSRSQMSSRGLEGGPLAGEHGAAGMAAVPASCARDMVGYWGLLDPLRRDPPLPYGWEAHRASSNLGGG